MASLVSKITVDQVKEQVDLLLNIEDIKIPKDTKIKINKDIEKFSLKTKTEKGWGLQAGQS
jgi:hypothetical protein